VRIPRAKVDSEKVQLMRNGRLLAVMATVPFTLMLGSSAAGAVSVQSSCVGKFVTSIAPQSQGGFGQTVAGLAQTTEPNLGQGDVTIDALSPHDQCRSS
jgi:hypothetical protein